MASGTQEIGPGFVSKRRILILAFVLAALAVGMAAFDYAGGFFEQGAIPLEVHVESKGNPQIVHVSYVQLDSIKSAERLRDSGDEIDGGFNTPEEFDGKRFIANVLWDRRTSGFGRERWYWQYSALVLKFEFADGHNLLKVVEIPDGRRKRQVTVAIP